MCNKLKFYFVSKFIFFLIKKAARWVNDDQINIIELLLVHGANPNIQDKDGQTALMEGMLLDYEIMRFMQF